MTKNKIHTEFIVREPDMMEVSRILMIDHPALAMAFESICRERPFPNIDHIAEGRRGCMTCFALDCPIWQSANQNCWKSNPVPNSKELIQMAHTEWANREERKGKHDELSWVSGWISGFLSSKKPNWEEVSK